MVVFGLLKRGDNVYTEVVPNATRRIPQAIVQERLTLPAASTRPTGVGYDGLVDVGYDKHLRVNHGKN